MNNRSIKVKVTVDNISVHTLCKHHMLPFYGKVSISYVTDGYTLGLSKFKRIIDFTASELTTQEELTQKIVKNIVNVLAVKELHVTLECVHSCMVIRGVKDLHTKTITDIHLESPCDLKRARQRRVNGKSRPEQKQSDRFYRKVNEEINNLS